MKKCVPSADLVATRRDAAKLNAISVVRGAEDQYERRLVRCLLRLRP
jgi:hypothetical protein